MCPHNKATTACGQLKVPGSVLGAGQQRRTNQISLPLLLSPGSLSSSGEGPITNASGRKCPRRQDRSLWFGGADLPTQGKGGLHRGRNLEVQGDICHVDRKWRGQEGTRRQPRWRGSVWSSSSPGAESSLCLWTDLVTRERRAGHFTPLGPFLSPDHV